ncbi:Integrator complex subunit 6 [Clonorchis sinensis]|uniref:Integrator complex subunit 6 n=1 Tax=Clonorchis sinensis TaxID=79923 RepID=A0A8T1MIQ5_CLOSI|nr:Integrator complex subunit 6 [Clonorchis sinensis]
MTIIVFLIDNSASMNQRTIQGTTLLDVAKSATELFFKIRLNKSRVDRYFILTLDNDCQYVKLAGWRQNVDLQCIHAALNTIKADGQTPLSVGLQRTFRMLNLNRLQLGLENYGMGMFPSYIEPAVILCITDGCCSTSLDESILKDVSMSSIETTIFGQPLTSDSFRWDYRLYSVILRYPGFVETVDTTFQKSDMNELPVVKTSELTGGKGFYVSDNRELQQCLESLAPKCQPAVVIDFTPGADFEQSETSTHDENTHKQLVYIKLMGRVCSNWPIPETFWLDDELISSHLPARPAHPRIFVSTSQVQVPNMPEYFPVDRYELEPSLFTQMLCIRDPAKVWQCFGADGKHAQSAPFGYLKSSPDLQTVHLHVLPYDYPNFCHLLNELYEVHHMRMSEAWGHRFVGYLSSIPRYYFMPLTKAFERFGFQSVIKPEAVDRVLPYQLKHTLQKLRHAAKIEYDNFVRTTQNGEHSLTNIKLPASLLPFPLWSLRELRPSTGRRVIQSATHPYARAADIERSKLRIALRRMRRNLDAILGGRQTDSHDSSVHEQPVATMGDYLSYKAAHEFEPVLREINPSPERLDTFGNPFRKKTTASFIADEVYVDEMGLTAGVPGSANATLVVPGRKRQHTKSSNTVVRNKGPLPAYINHLNWREFSPKNSPPNSPIPNHSADDTVTTAAQKQAPTLPTFSKHTGKAISNKDAFILNERVVRDLTRIVREPHTDGSGIFARLNDLSGSLAQRYAAISVIMSEALRFKRSMLYTILKDWRQWIIRSEAYLPALVNSDNRQTLSELVAPQVNGWG